MKLTKDFKGVPAGAIYPVEYLAGDECPPELHAAACAVGALPSADEQGRRLDGPTVADYVAAGYNPANYPPSGYASRSSEEEVAAAIAAWQPPAGSDPLDRLTVAELKSRLQAQGAIIPSDAKKADLLALLQPTGA